MSRREKTRSPLTITGKVQSDRSGNDEYNPDNHSAFFCADIITDFMESVEVPDKETFISFLEVMHWALSEPSEIQRLCGFPNFIQEVANVYSDVPLYVLSIMRKISDHSDQFDFVIFEQPLLFLDNARNTLLNTDLRNENLRLLAVAIRKHPEFWVSYSSIILGLSDVPALEDTVGECIGAMATVIQNDASFDYDTYIGRVFASMFRNSKNKTLVESMINMLNCGDKYIWRRCWNEIDNIVQFLYTPDISQITITYRILASIAQSSAAPVIQPSLVLKIKDVTIENLETECMDIIEAVCNLLTVICEIPRVIIPRELTDALMNLYINGHFDLKLQVSKCLTTFFEHNEVSAITEMYEADMYGYMLEFAIENREIELYERLIKIGLIALHPKSCCYPFIRDRVLESIENGMEVVDTFDECDSTGFYIKEVIMRVYDTVTTTE